MPMGMLRLACLLLFVAGLALATAVAAAAPRIGIGDQNAQMFSDPAFRALGIEYSRLALAWDWYKDDYTRARTDEWMAAARAARVRPLIAFNRNWSAGGERRLPSVAAYRASFRLFRARYPRVQDFSAWNEANHPTQPTFRKPWAAARFYRVLRAECRTCAIVAADVLDSSNMVGWLKRFKRRAPGARLWGLHNYKDANDRHSRGTKALLRTVPGRVWLTETGGIRRLKPSPGSRGKGRRHTRAQQAGAVKHVYRIARRHRRVVRIYFYEWRAQPDNRWDSAFVDADGTLRPAYRALKRGLR
jgi:hypothetical protein